MRPLLRALIGLCMAAGVARSLHAQDDQRNDRLAVVPDTTKRSIGPGSSTTARVVVQELAGVAQDFVVYTRLPEGWHLLSEPVTTHVSAKGRAFRLVQFQVPADAEAGEYSVIQAVRAPGLDTDLEARTTVVVTVRRSIVVALVDEPNFAPSGSRIHTTFLVTNRGNARTKVRLRVRTEPGVSATADTLSELKPGESREVGVDVDAGQTPNGEEILRHVSLIAEAEGGGPLDDGPAAPAAGASVRVVQRSSSADAPWFALPANLRLTSTQSGRMSSSFELSGGGPLNDSSTTTLEFFARGRQPAQSFFSERDEYRVAVTSNAFSARLGDQMFRLSPLTDPGTFTSGVSLSGTRGNWTAGAQTGRDRWSMVSSQYTTFVKFEPNPSFSIAANAMESNRVRSGTLGSLYLRAMPSAHSFLELEQGLGIAGGGAGAGATMLRVAGDQGWIAFDARAIRADSGFLTHSNGNQSIANVTLRPVSWIRVAGRANLQPLRQTSELTMDLARFFAAGLHSASQESAPGPMALLSGQGVGAEQSQWIRFAAAARRINMMATFERGTLDRRDGAPAIPFSTSRIQSGLALGSAASVSGFVERTTGQRLYMIEPATIVSAGASTSLQIGRASLALVGTAAPGSRFSLVPDSAWMLPGATASLDAAIGYALPSGRSLSLRLHTTATGPGKPVMTVARIAYDIPLHVPVGRSRTASRVMGRVYDAETGAGVPNALVRVGDQLALTDDDGRVAFGRLAPSRYPVRVDLGALQAAGAGLEDRLLEVDALAGRTTDLGIRVTRMGRIGGTISLFDRTGLALAVADTTRLRRIRGLGGILVTFVNGSEERRVLSRADGSFELRDARPGVWRVSASTDQLPKEHAIEGDSVRVVDLPAGGSAQLELRVAPRVRRILPLDAPPSASPIVPTPTAPTMTPPPVQPITQPIVTPRALMPMPSPNVAAPSVKVAKTPPAVAAKTRARKSESSPVPRVARVAPRHTLELTTNAWPFAAQTPACAPQFAGAVLPALATCRR